MSSLFDYEDGDYGDFGDELGSPWLTGPPGSTTPADGDRFWVPPGQPVTVKGRLLPDGMVYVGSGLGALASWRGAEPALIDPSLPVAKKDPGIQGAQLFYQPSYTWLSAPCRAAYLGWLAGGRRGPVHIGYVYLFLYGLERRLLFDAPGSEQARAERDALLAEIERLVGLYGSWTPFREQGVMLLQAARLQDAVPSLADLPPPEPGRYQVSELTLHLALSLFAAAGERVPGPWALAWLQYWRGCRLRTPAQRCPEEFHQLFALRYRESFRKGGIQVKPGSARFAVSYQPASGGFGQPLLVPFGQGLRQIAAQNPPYRKLQKIVDQVCAELAPYSRWVGRTGDTDSPAALELLPAELSRDREGEGVRQFREWVEQSLGDRGSALVDEARLVDYWPCQTPGKLTRREAEALARFLASRSYGMEPDPRFGGPAGTGRIVLFRLPAGPAPSEEATEAYRGATLLLHLAVAVAAADGAANAEEERFITEHLERAPHLDAHERSRLKAHLRWRLAAPPGLGGLKARLKPVPEAQRRSIGQFLVTLAGADEGVNAEELKILTAIYKLLGLEAQSVYSDAHALAGAAHPPAPDAVTVRPAAAGPAGFALPPPPREPNPKPNPKEVTLDREKVRAMRAETERASSLLGGIFGDSREDGEAAAATPPIRGLDAAHSALLRQLATRPVWPRDEVERLADALGLLPEGALEVINEAAFERSGSLLLEGDETIEIDTTVLEEILA